MKMCGIGTTNRHTMKLRDKHFTKFCNKRFVANAINDNHQMKGDNGFISFCVSELGWRLSLMKRNETEFNNERHLVNTIYNIINRWLLSRYLDFTRNKMFFKNPDIHTPYNESHLKEDLEDLEQFLKERSYEVNWYGYYERMVNPDMPELDRGDKNKLRRVIKLYLHEQRND